MNPSKRDERPQVLLTPPYVNAISISAWMARAAARPGQARAPAKHEVAVLAQGRVEQEPPVPLAVHRPGDVRQMFFDLPLGNAEAVGEVPGGTAGPGDHLNDLLSDGHAVAGHGALGALAHASGG